MSWKGGIMNRQPKTKVIANVRVGTPQANPSASSHVRGVKSGNANPNLEHEGLCPNDDGATATMRRATGINPEAHAPIDPRMPVLTPP